MAKLGLFVFGLILGAWYSFVSWCLWDWFAVPVGAPTIGYWYAFGLYTLAASVLLWGAPPPTKNFTNEELATQETGKGLLAAIILLEGWIVHLIAGPHLT